MSLEQVYGIPIDQLLRPACSVLLPSMVLEFKAQKRRAKGDPGIHTDVAAMLRQWLQMLLKRAPSNRRITRDMAAVAPERCALFCMRRPLIDLNELRPPRFWGQAALIPKACCVVVRMHHHGTREHSTPDSHQSIVMFVQHVQQFLCVC